MAGLEVDFSELLKLRTDIESAPATLPRRMTQAVEVTSRKVKDSARKKVGKRKHFKAAAGAIDYELKNAQMFGSTLFDSEVGYDKDKPAGKLGNLVEYGAPRSGNQLAPGGELQAALNENADDLEAGIEKAIDDALKAVGL